MSGFARKTVLASALAIGLLASAPAARAQMLVAEVGGSLMQQILTQANTYRQTFQAEMEYLQQARRWYETYQHYQQELVRIQGMVNSFARPRSKQLKPVPEDYLVTERCGGELSLSNVLQAVAPVREGDFIGQQRLICQHIQLTKNRQFNETVEFLTRTIPEMESDMAALLGRRNSSNAKGNVDNSIADSTRMNAQLNVELESFKSQMQGYENYLAVLKSTQAQLAEMALKGKRGALGTLVKTAALKAALEVRN